MLLVFNSQVPHPFANLANGWETTNHKRANSEELAPPQVAQGVSVFTVGIKSSSVCDKVVLSHTLMQETDEHFRERPILLDGSS